VSRNLSLVYRAALANLVALAIWGLLFDVPDALSAFSSLKASGILVGVELFLAVCIVGFSVPLILLIRRPMGWGKLLLFGFGIAWIMHGAMEMLMGSLGMSLHIRGTWVPIACGVLMFALALWHQTVDPRFFPPHQPVSLSKT
jgi:hypothetical protein